MKKKCYSGIFEIQDFLKKDTIIYEDVFIDSRDGQSYQCVNIGGQVWLAENFRYNPDFKLPSIKCKRINCSNRCCGVLYDASSAQKVVPEGWHIPSVTECYNVIHYFGAMDSSRCMQQYEKLICYSNDILNLSSRGNTRYCFENDNGYFEKYKFPGNIYWTSTYSKSTRFGSGYYNLVVNESLGRLSIDKSNNEKQYFYLRLVKNK